jgi:hypothetical protein
MKLLRRIVLAVFLVLIPVLPALSFGDELLAPLEKKVPAGTSTISYGGQTLRFTTSVALLVKCDPELTNKIRVTVSLYPGTPLPKGPGTAAIETLSIYWVNFGTDVYDGGIPDVEPWVGTLNTEGGFVDR